MLAETRGPARKMTDIFKIPALGCQAKPPRKFYSSVSPATCKYEAKYVAQNLDCSLLMMDPTEYFTNSASMDPTIIKTDRYTRRTHIIHASVPKPGDVSMRGDLSSRLRLAVHEYNVIEADSSGYTLILTHGTSFNKFFWELVIDYMLSKPGVKTAVKRVITIDAANHGDSAVLNREVLPSKGEPQFQ